MWNNYKFITITKLEKVEIGLKKQLRNREKSGRKNKPARLMPIF